MATQPIPIDPLGEHSSRRRYRTRQLTKAQEYLQGLMSSKRLTYVNMTIPSVSGEEVLAKTDLQQELEGPGLVLDVQGVSQLASRSRPVLEAIDALLAGGEDEVVPTRFAYERARSVVEAAYGQVKTHKNVPTLIPRPLVTTDDVGGIRLSWRTSDRQVRANFGARPDLRSYIYFESALEHSVEPLDAQHLARRLAWLTGR